LHLISSHKAVTLISAVQTLIQIIANDKKRILRNGQGEKRDWFGRGRNILDGLAAHLRPSHHFSVYQDRICRSRRDLVTTYRDYPLQESLSARRVGKEDHLSSLRSPRVERIHSRDDSLVQANCRAHRIAWNSKGPRLKRLYGAEEYYDAGNHQEPNGSSQVN